MIIKDIKNSILKNIDSQLIKNILKHVLKKDVFFDDDKLTDSQILLIENIVKKLNKGYMLEHILGYKYFYKNKFFVNKNVLIPRKETELLVEEVLKNNLKNKTIVDLCCGSGCIGISIALEQKDCKVYLADISKKALKIAKNNISKYDLSIKLYKTNFLKFLFKNNINPDILIINPPYIDKKDKTIDNKVKKYEPKIALFAKNDGLYFYKSLLKNIDKLYSLNQNLIIYSEFGYNQKEKLEKIFEIKRVKYNIEFKKDLSNNWRYFILKKD
ncbi:release factor glutamine methyltransferase [Spiroplasma litorale]|uniref:peptide chain release factor N(5)-glutamine methyltransferase n=1 Tax=Spiroplasma litorale TaxID=216942 RepID=A0A0K1W3B5_9MOLU|nr:peptide chain release factor N(5)-glutamine methyltransferase [Spiroplasma litorale]AKX34673.1 release factor glutamine methyltransferase [Spiroplasma litorale]